MLRRGRLGVIGLVILGLASPAAAQQGRLETLREDVRSPSSSEDRDDWDDDTFSDSSSDGNWSSAGAAGDGSPKPFFSELLEASAGLAGLAVVSPVWGPHVLVGDDFTNEGFFPRFPYEDPGGYMLIDGASVPSRRWAGQFQMEYADDLDGLEHVGGRLLLETTSRWGIDLRTRHLEERVATDQYDALWLGDANVVFRFAQSPRWQWRGGMGLNWLDDARDRNFGVNFTYGFDFFPRRPWVLSSTIDWGTLGSAWRFRFATTAGVTSHGVEAYTGYEYHDIDHFHSSSLIGGVRIWF